MALKTCMNILCATTSSAEWKTGWRLRSGELANLCDKCGYAFEQRVYCEEFHADDSGWRECVTCSKRLHCGCIASWSLIELLDGGGVKCISCARNLGANSSSNDGKRDGSGTCALRENDPVMKQLINYTSGNGISQPSKWRNVDSNAAVGLLKQEELLLPLGDVGLQKAGLDISTIGIQAKDHYELIAHPNLNITLGIPTGNLLSMSSAIVGEREQRKMSNAFHQGLVSHHLLPTPPKLDISQASDTSVSVMPQVRVARPPVEGRGRHQLLPRYWPRITDQELKQISGDSNCTIVPLFEKVLSASDAGRIGRLVLPKACAEAYFPPISQPEGLPIKIQDVKGKEWVFQFRFWPNNNSRMYVLEGVTPCIQSMQLQAGDTVTFSRMEPDGKLVMGFRKASNSTAMQDAESSVIRNAPLSSECFFSGVIEKLPIISGSSGLLQSTKGSTGTHMNALSRQLDSTGGNTRWHNNEKYGERTVEGMLPTPVMMTERKKSRNIGSKSKRLLIDSQDVLALRLTWEEVQGLLQPPRSANPSIVVVEDYEFEEYEEPPVFGKSSIFTARTSGVVEQWAQCDSCSKWRRLPADISLPPKWTCAQNEWDQTRCFCSAPDELGPKELENFLQLSKDSKKKRMAMANRSTMTEQESSGLDALANAAASGDNTSDPGSSSVAATTKHPRHRPGCSCIVCIQPPSGKGKHKSTCTCTVCSMVKRRFKTLMMRKKKRQSEQEALKNNNHQTQTQTHSREDDHNPDHHRHESEEDLQVGPAQINCLDLNCHPEREEDLRVGIAQASMTNLLDPLEAYMNQNSLTSFTNEQQASSTSHLGRVSGESEGKPVEDHLVGQALHEQVSRSDGSGASDNNKQQNEPL